MVMRKDVVAGALFAALVTVAAAASGGSEDRLKRGEYLATIMDCTGCHTPGALVGQPDKARELSGSEVGFKIPGAGIFYPPNLTSDPETGIGHWSEADIVKAVRTGVRPDGRVLVPIMPYHSYARLTDGDAHALAAYLKSVPPVNHAVPKITGDGERPTAAYLAIVAPK